MLEPPTAMRVARIKSSRTDKQGRRREYESRLLRRTYHDGGKVRHETLANLSKLVPCQYWRIAPDQQFFAS